MWQDEHNIANAEDGRRSSVRSSGFTDDTRSHDSACISVLCFGCRCAKRLVSGTKHTRSIIAPDPVQGVGDPASVIHTLPSSLPLAWFCSCLLLHPSCFLNLTRTDYELGVRQCRRCPAVPPQMPPPRLAAAVVPCGTVCSSGVRVMRLSLVCSHVASGVHASARSPFRAG